MIDSFQVRGRTHTETVVTTEFWGHDRRVISEHGGISHWEIFQVQSRVAW